MKYISAYPQGDVSYHSMKKSRSKKRQPGINLRRIAAVFFTIFFVSSSVFVWVFLTNKQVEAGWYGGSGNSAGRWTARKKITVKDDKVAGTTALSNFPVLISLTDADLAAKAQQDADDIVFTQSDGTTKLNHEIESYSNSNGKLTAWVNITSLSATSDTVIYMYYGNAKASSQQNVDGTWSSDYVAVYHLNQSSTGAVDEFVDSAGGNNDGRGGNGNTSYLPSRVDGQIGYAQDFDVAASDFIQAADHNDLDITSEITMQAWVKPDTIGGGTNQLAVTKYDAYFLDSTRSFDTDCHAYIFPNGAGANKANCNDNLSTTEWSFMTGTYKQSDRTIRMYINGLANGTHEFASNYAISTSTQPLEIARGAGTSYYDGKIDEVRILRVSRTPEWIQTEYNNQQSPDAFYNIGSEQGNEAELSLYWKFDEGGGSYAQDSSLARNTGSITSANYTGLTPNNRHNGYVLAFDGTASTVQKAYSSDSELNPEKGSVSISAWFKHSSAVSNTDTIASRFNNGGYKIYMQSDGTVCVGIDDDGVSFPLDYSCSVLRYDDSRWHHVEAVKDGTSSLTLYIDGQAVGIPDTSITTNSISGSSPTFSVGADSNNSNYWDGFIDEVKIYMKPRSAQQVLTDYNGQAAYYGAGTVFGTNTAIQSLNQGLVGYWKMDELTGDTCLGGANDSCDSSGNVKDAAWQGNTTTTTTAKFNRSVTLDGTGDYLSTNYNPGFTQSSGFSVAAWIKTSQNTLGSIISNGCGFTGSFSLRTDGSSNGANFCIHDTNGTQVNLNSYKAVNDGNWHLITGVRDIKQDRILIYVDGQLYQSAPDTTTGNFNSYNLNLGARGNDAAETYAGLLDEARVYNRALSTAEVAQIYEWAPGPRGHWKFDEGSGNTVKDSSGNNYTADWNGTGPHWGAGKYGKAGLFKSSHSDVVSLSDTDNIWDFEDDDFTIGLWYKTATTSTDWDAALTKRSSGAAAGGLVIARNLTNMNFYATSNGSSWDIAALSFGAVAANSWTHFSVSRSGSTWSFYKNGVHVNTLQSSAAIQPNNDVLRLGGDADSLFLDGSIDDVRIYNYGRTPKQIIEDMNASHPAGESPVGSAVGHWKFDEGFGETVHDTTTYARNADLAGNSSCPGHVDCPSWTNAGKFNKGLSYDGGSDYISIGDSGSSDNLRLNGASELTLSAWVNITDLSSSSEHAVISKYSYASNTGYAVIILNTGAVRFNINGSSNSYSTSTGVISAGRWYHIAAVFSNGNTMKIMINGVPQLDQSISSTAITASSNSFALGTPSDNLGNDSFALHGLIDEVKLYNYALSLDEIKVEYNQGKSAVMGAVHVDPTGIPSFSADKSYCVPGDIVSCTAPIAEWKLDEKRDQIMYDISGNNYGGTLGNSANTDSADPVWTSGRYGGALSYLNTGSQYVDVASHAGLSVKNQQKRTISAWVNVSDVTSRRPVLYESVNGSNSRRLELSVDTDRSVRLTGKYSDGGATDVFAHTAASTITLNTWIHLTGIVDGTTGSHKIYINGIDRTSTTVITTGTFSNTNPSYFRLGNNTTYNFYGKIDNVRIYDYVRTPAQVAWDYNRGGPVGWWKFDECQGDTAYDSSGNGTTGAWTGPADPQTAAGSCTTSGTARGNGANGRINSSLNFDGADDQVSVGHPPVLDTGNAFTLAAWVKPSSAPSGAGVIAESYTAAGDPVQYELGFGFNEGGGGSSQLKVGFYDGSNWNLAAETSNIATGSWIHIAGTWDGTTLRLYKNGREVAVSTPGGSVVTDTDTIYIGRRHDTAGDVAYFPGLIDDARIYNYALTPIQIKTLVNSDAAVQFLQITGSP